MTEPHTPWSPVDIAFEAAKDHQFPYTEVELEAEFRHPASGTVVRRPAFWDGGRRWAVRFASPGLAGEWTWRTVSSVADPGLHGRTGTLTIGETDPAAASPFRRHGFWRMSPGGRSLVHADGAPALIVADTAWGLPWRATAEQARTYAADRAAKGFNAALLMSVMPDMDARGPRDRTADGGFDIAFEDLRDGGLDRMVPAYFQRLDELLGILDAHGIVPVLQPVFHGFGWKGLRVAGPVVPPASYARYCRYLVARYGASPAVWLVGADGRGDEPQIAAGGREIEAWDGYHQPTGIHYRPHGPNNASQEASWLDFQWCQTGHRGEHLPERVADMWRNLPVKAVANGEPSYEHTGGRGVAAGWWQGHEAWSNLCAGGTMGVVYGAGSLWQWVQRVDEPGQAPFFMAPGASWREALDFEGSTYVGLLRRILDGVPTTDMAPDWQTCLATRGLLSPGRLFLAYSEHGGTLQFSPDAGDTVPLPYRVMDPRTGKTIASGARTGPLAPVEAPEGEPLVYLCFEGADA
ncbi:apiosidase-like domain-containing protein [Streptomyces sp. NBC_01465]|uniref:apiosidase-like domain-containing protein n=1 Tax=Streptomyces sp. NBC_01465 TaxID=2903878 RepID=UPI002E2FEC55|nr:DUF4038 domain-containing protein [Streptomyces sp. NBC_01465]